MTMDDWDAQRTDVSIQDFLLDLSTELPPRIAQRVRDARAVLVAHGTDTLRAETVQEKLDQVEALYAEALLDRPSSTYKARLGLDLHLKLKDIKKNYKLTTHQKIQFRSLSLSVLNVMMGVEEVPEITWDD